MDREIGMEVVDGDFIAAGAGQGSKEKGRA